jgi:hypothetical protein
MCVVLQASLGPSAQVFTSVAQGGNYGYVSAAVS